jgi:hypothetical protein
VRTPPGTQKRKLDLGDSDDQFLVVDSGLKAGDEVVINPIAHIEEAQKEALKPFSGVKTTESSEDQTAPEKTGREGEPGKPESPQESPTKSQANKPKITGAQILKLADKNQDGVLTKDEFSEKDQGRFDEADLNKDGEVNEAELDAGIKKLTEAGK